MEDYSFWNFTIASGKQGGKLPKYLEKFCERRKTNEKKQKTNKHNKQ